MKAVLVTPTAASLPPKNSNAPELSWRLVRTNGRPADTVAFEESVIAFFLDAASILGIPKSVAAIYGICFASAKPLSFTDVQQRLGISAGSISQGLRVLQEVGALKVVRSNLDRRGFFTPDLELRKLIARYLEERLESQLQSGRARLQAITKAIPIGEDGSRDELKMRMKAVQTWHDKARAAVPLIKLAMTIT